MNKFITVAIALIVLVSVLDLWEEIDVTDVVQGGPEEVMPNWSSIAAWPNVETPTVEATPDPNRRITAIVLDDSGSMGADIVPAKAAVLEALNAMADHDRVAVVALNHGIVLPFTQVGDAKAALPDALAEIKSDGSTPLTQAVTIARSLLEDEAAAARSFGTYRMIVTTDGQADDGKALEAVVADMAAATPIQLATIGIDIRGRHVLRREDLGSFVDVSNIAALRGALEAAVAENSDFAAITEFAEEG